MRPLWAWLCEKLALSVLLFSYSPSVSPNSIKPCGLDCKLLGTFPPTRNNLRESNGKKSRLQSMFIRGPRSSHRTALKIIFMITHKWEFRQAKTCGQIKALSSYSHRPWNLSDCADGKTQKALKEIFTRNWHLCRNGHTNNLTIRSYIS